MGVELQPCPTCGGSGHVGWFRLRPCPLCKLSTPRAVSASLPQHPVPPVVTEAITDADGAPVLVYMVLDQHNTPVAHSQDKDDADFAACQLVNDEQVLRVVPCHLTAASEVRG